MCQFKHKWFWKKKKKKKKTFYICKAFYLSNVDLVAVSWLNMKTKKGKKSMFSHFLDLSDVGQVKGSCLWAKLKIIYFKVTTNRGMQYVRFWKWCATTLLYNWQQFSFHILSFLKNIFQWRPCWEAVLPIFEEPNTITLPMKWFCINMEAFWQQEAEFPTRPPSPPPSVKFCKQKFV